MKVTSSTGRAPAISRIDPMTVCTRATAARASNAVYWAWFRNRPRAAETRHHVPTPSDASMMTTANGVHTRESLSESEYG